VIATRRERLLEVPGGHVGAASGLVLREADFCVVADDEHHLGVFPRDGGPGRLQRLLPGDLPPAKPERKARKPDFEILLPLPDGALLAMGSGSRPTRERAVLLDAELAPRRTIDTSAICARLRPHFPQLNLEGAALLGEEWVLLQRGSGEDPRNAMVFYPAASLHDGLSRGAFDPGAPRIVAFDLGESGGVRWSVTDAVADGDALWLTAVLEDTCDSYADGACLGAALARVSRDGRVQRFERLDTEAKNRGTGASSGSSDSTRKRRSQASRWRAKPPGWSAMPTIRPCRRNC